MSIAQMLLDAVSENFTHDGIRHVSLSCYCLMLFSWHQLMTCYRIPGRPMVVHIVTKSYLLEYHT